MLSIITPSNEIDMFLPEGFYSDVYQLVDRCNRMIERNLKEAGTIVDTKFTYDATSRKISVHVGADNVVTLSSDLASIMGFSPRQLTFREERKYKGMVAMDPTEDSTVYTSIAMRLKLYQWTILRLPSTSGRCCRNFFLDLVHRLYTMPQYFPVSRKEFNNVEIDIRDDDSGRPVQFEFGKVVVTLHFHLSRNPYFLS